MNKIIEGLISINGVAILLVPTLFGVIFWFFKRTLKSVEDSTLSAKKKADSFSNSLDTFKTNLDTKINSFEKKIDEKVESILKYSRMNEESLANFREEIIKEKAELKTSVKEVELQIDYAMKTLSNVEKKFDTLDRIYGDYIKEIKGSSIRLKEFEGKIHFLSEKQFKISGDVKTIISSLSASSQIIKRHNSEISVIKKKLKKE